MRRSDIERLIVSPFLLLALCAILTGLSAIVYGQAGVFMAWMREASPWQVVFGGSVVAAIGSAGAMVLGYLAGWAWGSADGETE